MGFTIEPPNTLRALNQSQNPCDDVYPEAINCSKLPKWYIYDTPQQAFKAIKRREGISNLKLEKRRRTKKGPCPGQGLHYNVKHGRRYIASIVGCPCCKNTSAGAVMKWRYGIWW